MTSTTNEPTNGIIEVDDNESGYGTSATKQSETTSLSSSLEEWLMENGRRYHAYYGPDKNMMPTDAVEQERLDLHHEAMLLISNGDLYKAPIKDAQRVLDLGTGTGIWATDYAVSNPEAEVIGVDLSPIQPNWVPPNCRFEVDDFELEWTFQHNSFDFIHARNIVHSVKDITAVLKQVMSHLKPGAWFELAELGCVLSSDDNSIPADWAPNKCFKLLVEGLTQLGRVVPESAWLRKVLVDAGFVDVEVKTFKQPLMPWPKQKDLKQAGALCTIQTETAYHAYLMSLLTRVLGWTAEDADAICKAAHAAHLEKKTGVHAYNKLLVKPGEQGGEVTFCFAC